MTSGGNKFNYFPENHLTKFKLCPPTYLFYFPPEDFHDSFCVVEGAFGRPWTDTAREGRRETDVWSQCWSLPAPAKVSAKVNMRK